MQIRLSKPLAIDILFVSKFPSCTRSLSAIPPPPLPAPYGCLRLALPPLLKAEETERKAEETEEKEKKSKGGVSCPPHDNCFYIIKVTLLGGGACGCAYLFRALYPAPERHGRAKVKGGKAVYIPLTFALCRYNGAWARNRAEWGRQAGGGAATGTEKETSGGRKGEGARTTSPAPRARTSPERAHSEGD